MNDRELLEYAAKAAGYNYKWIERFPEDGYPCYSFGLGLNGNILFNPLIDDGDALRLAVKLGMLIDVRYGSHENLMKKVRVTYWIDPSKGLFIESNSNNYEYEVRRNIVRAAAEIEKAKS